MGSRALRLLRNAARHPNPLRYVLSRLLWVSGLSEWFTVRLPYGVRVRFYPSSMSATLFTDPAYGLEDMSFVHRYLREGETYVDVGANIGHIAMAAAMKVGPAGRVIAIEPHPRTFGYLEGNLRLNGLSRRARLHNVAVGDREGHVEFTDKRSDEMNQVTAGPGIRVPVVTLDHLLGDLAVDLLKVDAEGYEPFILRGAARVLERTGCVYIEASGPNLAAFGHTVADLVALLEANGFQVFHYSGGRLSEIEAAGDVEANLVALKGSVAQSRV